MNIFPFTLERFRGERLFTTYLQPRKQQFDEQHGRRVLTSVNGKTGTFRRFSWITVTVQVTSPTEVRFIIDVNGRESLTIDHVLDTDAELRKEIEQHKRDIAEQVFLTRQLQERQRAIDAVYNELFGDPK